MTWTPVTPPADTWSAAPVAGAAPWAPASTGAAAWLAVAAGAGAWAAVARVAAAPGLWPALLPPGGTTWDHGATTWDHGTTQWDRDAVGNLWTGAGA